jgi:hypothetical protein
MRNNFFDLPKNRLSAMHNVWHATILNSDHPSHFACKRALN